MAQDLTISSGVTAPITFKNVVPISATDRVNTYRQGVAYSAKFAEYMGQRIAKAAQQTAQNTADLGNIQRLKEEIGTWLPMEMSDLASFQLMQSRSGLLKSAGFTYQPQVAIATPTSGAAPVLVNMPVIQVEDAAGYDFELEKTYQITGDPAGPFTVKRVAEDPSVPLAKLYLSDISAPFSFLPSKNLDVGHNDWDIEYPKWVAGLDPGAERLSSETQAQQVMFQDLSVAYGRWLETAGNVDASGDQAMSALRRSIRGN